MSPTEAVRRFGRAPARVAACILCLAAPALAAPGARAEDRIALEMPIQAHRIFRHMKKQGYHNVGVLPFRAQKGDEDPSFGTGPLNRGMAVILENALILANDPEEPFGIISRAYETAFRKDRKATCMTREGAQKLFEHDYPLAWGDSTVRADALLTGLVKLSKDRKTTAVTIEVIDAASKGRKELTSFSVPTDRSILNGLYEGFMIDSKRMRTMAVKDIDKEAADSSHRPPTPQDSWLIDVQVLYNGKSQAPVKTGPMQFDVAEPSEKDGVTLRLKNVSDVEVGVVVAVNDENTLYREKVYADTAERCSMWILKPGQEGEVRGFYTEDNKHFEPFKVLPTQLSHTLEELNPDNHLLGKLQVFEFQKVAARVDSGLMKPLPATKRPANPEQAARAVEKLNSREARLVTAGIIIADKKLDDTALTRTVFDNPQQRSARIITYRKKGGGSGE
jgi:hypothetical protein